MKAKITVFVLLLSLASDSFGQSRAKTSLTPAQKGVLFSPHYAYHIPGGDMKDRFYRFSSVGMGIHYATKKGWFFGLEYDWYFGNSVKEADIFDSIKGPSELIIDRDGNFSVYRLQIKGNVAMLSAGYILPTHSDYRQNGFCISAGAGFMQHKIDILSSEISIPQINDEYEKGYDRLTYGFATRQYFGYQYLVQDNRIHIRGGIEFNQGFTKGRRSWNFTTNSPGTGKRFDSTLALKIAIVVPVYTKDKEDEEFFFN